MKNLLFLLLFLIVAANLTYSQVTIHVPGDYQTIQEGINAANNGDIVLVAEGTYYENINFMGKAITVASHFLTDGNTVHISSTTINGSQPSNPDSASVVFFLSGEDTTSVLHGFTITGGTGTYNQSSDIRGGGGICIYESGAKICYNIIEYNTVTYNPYAYGAGIVAYSMSHTVIIKNNIIRNNTLTGNISLGGGISLVNCGKTIIESNRIIDNIVTGASPNGGGIDIYYSSDEVIVNNNLIKGNNIGMSGYCGGGIDLTNWDAPVLISNNLIIENTGKYGGGVMIDYYLDESSNSSHQISKRGFSEIIVAPEILNFVPILVNNTINNNSAIYGGGIWCKDFAPDVMNSIIWGNQPTQIAGTVTANVEWSDVQGGYAGTGNIDLDPQIDLTSEYCVLLSSSPCIDAGNPDPMYFDVGVGGNPLPPAQGSLINDMGHCGGPNSCWCYWLWPVPVELTSFTATSQLGKVILNWTTATEINNLGFEIERKIIQNQSDGEWIRIAFVEGHGTTTEPKEYTYLDDISDIQATTFVYRLKQMDFLGTYEYSDEVMVENPAPVDYVLYQNYPNPFNPTTTITFGIPVKAHITLKVFNAVGEEVAQLCNGEKEAGRYTFEFNAEGLPSGVYFYQLKTENYVKIKKMILMK